MAYENNNSGSGSTTSTITYASPDTGEYSNVSKLQNLGEVYILPTGHIWSGKVHQAEDGSWVTGEVANAASVAVVKVPLVPEFPNGGLVGKEDIFKQVFESISSWSNASEGNITNLNGRIVELGTQIESNYSLITLALNKILNFIEQNNIQTESAGTGQILDYEINYSLDAATAQDHNGKIQSIDYEHGSSNNIFIFNGNVSTGNTNEGWLESRTKEITMDMVSRTGAPLELNQLESILTLDKSYEPGFNGTIKIKVNGGPSISHIDLPTNGEITGVSLDLGETWLTEWHSFPAVTVNEIWILINKVSPVPFTSYVTTDLTTDLLGNPQADQYELNPPVYQRTELNIGKLKLSSISYAEEKEFESGPYYIGAGTLRSITMDAVEALGDQTDYDSYFYYKIVIAGMEYSITPWSRQGSNPRIYYINSALSEDVKQSLSEKGVGFIDTGSSEVSFKLKTKLIRPSDSFVTPQVKGLAFNYGTSLNGGING